MEFVNYILALGSFIRSKLIPRDTEISMNKVRRGQDKFLRFNRI
jgi:hypothetical protein